MANDAPHTRLSFLSDHLGTGRFALKKRRTAETEQRLSLGYQASTSDLYLAVVVAVLAAWMMQVAADKIVRVAAVRTASWPQSALC